MTLSEKIIKMLEAEFGDEIIEDLEEVDTYELFDHYLNESNPIKVGDSLYAKLLQENDENQYDGLYADWLDTLDKENGYFEIDEKYYLIEDVEELFEEFIDNIRVEFNIDNIEE